MPRATADISKQVKVLLKSCPPDGYVILRALPYGQYLHRREIAIDARMSMSQADAQGQQAPEELRMGTAVQAVARFEFANCIVDHNLEDENGVKLDFKDPATLDRLEPSIGEEIDDAITKLHEPSDTPPVGVAGAVVPN